MQRQAIALLLAGCVLVMVGVMPRESHAVERGTASHFGLGVGSIVCTIGWGLAKTVYAVAGSVTGGLAYAITGGRSDVARAIIQPSVRGDYVITPDHLTGARPLQFTGRDPLTTAHPR
jgi:hypothetical protein